MAEEVLENDPVRLHQECFVRACTCVDLQIFHTLELGSKEPTSAGPLSAEPTWFIHSFGEQKACLHVPFLLEKA